MNIKIEQRMSVVKMRMARLMCRVTKEEKNNSCINSKKINLELNWIYFKGRLFSYYGSKY